LSGGRSGPVRASLGLLYGLLLLMPGLLLARALQGEGTEPPAGDARSPTHITADRFIDRLVDGEPITYLIGNVVIDRDTVVAYSDTALYYREREVYELRGHVRLRQQQTTLTARRGIFRRQSNEADFHGDVRVEEEGAIGTARSGYSRRQGEIMRLVGNARLVTPEYTVFADTISRDRSTGVGEASGNVRIVDPLAHNLVTGQHALFYPDRGTARVDRQPELTSRERGQETFLARSGVMQFYREGQQVVMIDSVRIRQGLTSATSDTALAFGRERLLLRGAPQVHYAGQSTMIGNEIEFLYHQGELRRILLRGAARMEDATPESLAAHYAGLPSLDVLNGDTIIVEVAGGEVQRSTVLGRAQSVYVPTDVTDEIAFNEVSGDTIVLNFHAGRVRRVQVSSNMSGDYTFARISQMKPESPADSTAAGAAADTAASAADSTAAGAAADTLKAAPSPAIGPRTERGAPPDTLPADPAASSSPMARAGPLPLAGAVPDSGAAEHGAGPAHEVLDFTAGAEKVIYSGHEVVFHLAENKIEITGEAVLKYGTLLLTAHHVVLDTESREVYADGEPLLEDKEQKIAGERMGYNFAYKTGAVLDGVTTFEQNFYEGKEIKRFPDGTLKIRSGRMTACDLAEPHYHFWSNEMKIQLNDKVVARPVVLKIGRVPVFALPYYFKSLKSGRRSGILFPNFNFGWSSRTGRYIRDFGYYWATNDYTDFTFEGDYNERQEFTYRISNRYVKRYAFDGRLAYSRRLELADGGSSQWQLFWAHQQPKLLDAYRFDIKAEMSSPRLTTNNLTRDVGRDIVPGQLHTTATVQRSWSSVSSTLNLTRDEYPGAADENPVTNERLYTQTLPRLSLSFRERSILPPLPAGREGSFVGEVLRHTTISHNYNVSASRTKYETLSQRRYDASGSASLRIEPPRVWILNVGTGLSASQNWQRADTTGQRTYLLPDSTYSTRQVDGSFEQTSPSLSVNSHLGTVLYGVFPLRLGRLQAVRHTFDFAVSHSYRPQLGSKQRRQESYGFSLRNRFDIKYLAGAPTDSLPQVKKLDGLLDWSVRTSYNPQVTNGRYWSNLSSSLSIRPGQSQNLNFKVDNTIDPYAWRILSTRFSYGLNVRGRLDLGGGAVEEEKPRRTALDRLGGPADTLAVAEGLVDEGEFLGTGTNPEEEGAFAGYERPLAKPGEDPTEGGRFIPWNASLNFSFNRDSVNNTNSARGNLSLNTNLSRNWQLSYRASFDFVSGTTLSQYYTLTRDLHCWRMEFTRSIYTNDQEFGFRLYLISIPSIKVTRGKQDLLGTASQFSGGIF
jgi:lipopolysaccharide assembly outer membrane protein LptD (OstA)